jgi:hypothetical protein
MPTRSARAALFSSHSISNSANGRVLRVRPALADRCDALEIGLQEDVKEFRPCSRRHPVDVAPDPPLQADQRLRHDGKYPDRPMRVFFSNSGVIAVVPASADLSERRVSGRG